MSSRGFARTASDAVMRRVDEAAGRAAGRASGSVPARNVSAAAAIRFFMVNVANPWLIGPASRKRLPRRQLEERILNLLSSQNMCVLATTGADGALATPVRYYHRDLVVFFTCRPGTPKLRNIERDPRVSIGLFAPLVGQASSRGAQLFGAAEVLLPGMDGYADGMAIYRWQSDAVERGRPLDQEPGGPLVRLIADRVVYTEHWLRRDGFSPRQFWSRPAGPPDDQPLG